MNATLKHLHVPNHHDWHLCHNASTMSQSDDHNQSPPSISTLPEGAYTATRDGHRVHYLDIGKGEQVFVFLHGSGPGASGHSNFKFNYPDLAKAGHRVIVIDHIGYGLSDKPTDVEYHLDVFVGAVMDVLDHLKITSFVPIGNSLGGAVAIKITLDYPERVSRLILMAPGGVEEKESYFTMPGMQAMAKFFTGQDKSAAGLKKVLEELVHNKQHITAELVEERAQVFAAQHAGVIATMQVPNMTTRLPEIKCPVLVFWGANERFMPLGGALTLARSCASSQVLIQSKCGHWYMVEFARDFNRRCLEFLGA